MQRGRASARIYSWLCNSHKGYGSITWEEGIETRRKKKGTGMALEGVFLLFLSAGNPSAPDMDSFCSFELASINDSNCR